MLRNISEVEFVDSETEKKALGCNVVKNTNITGYYVKVLRLKQRRPHKKKRINKKWEKKYGYKLVEEYEELDM